jgi:hypothetical protein
MSPIKPVQSIRQQPRGRGKEQAEAEARQKLSRQETAIIAGSGFGIIGLLTLIAWLLLPVSGHIVPFVAVTAWPALTLLAIVYQAVVYRRQWNVMLDSMRQTDRVIDKMQAQLTAVREQTGVMQSSLTETQKMVEHSERGVQIAQQNMEYAQRACVMVVQKTFTRSNGFSLLIENCGNTPALEVSIDAVIGIGAFPPARTDKLENYKHVGLLAPRTQHPYVAELGRELTQEEHEEFDNEFTGPLCCWWITGWIYYRDIFQEKRDYHETDFCFFYGRNSDGVESHTSGNEIKVHRPNYPNYPEKIADPN